MLNGIPTSDYPKVFYRYVKGLFEVLIGKTSLKVYLSLNYPNFYKTDINDGKILTYNGCKFVAINVNSSVYMIDEILSGKYSIPQCSIKKGDVVFDIGAHFGFFSYYAMQKGASEIYAFEPNPYVFDILEKNVNLWNKKIKTYQIALFSSKGKSNFYLDNDLGLGSTLLSNRKRSILESIDYKESIAVDTITIDEFVKENGIKKLDFIKIDAEGSEKDILIGAKETIKRFKPKMAISAYHLPDDKEKIPEIVLSIRNDYDYKLACKGDEDLFFY